jgi:hypothetical protein
MTTARTLFCLEQLAKDHWMRVVIRAEHALLKGGEVAHRVTAPQPIIARIASVLSARDWATKMPAALTTYPGVDGAAGVAGTAGAAGPTGAARVTCLVGSGHGHRSSVAHDNLVSFVIA